LAATKSRGRSGWRAVYDVGRRGAVVVRTKTIGGGKAMPSDKTTAKEIVEMLDASADIIAKGSMPKIASVIAEASAFIRMQEETIQRQRELISRLDKELREDAAEIATLRKTISEQAATIERLRSKAELFDQLTRIE
jgi:septal ring factor EnvC (AmiA/AmiB activator)